MPFNTDIPFSELTWQNDADFRDRSIRDRESRDMQDWQTEDFARVDDEKRQARKEAAELNQWPMTCDGSGILDYETECKGCPACDQELMEFPGYHRTRQLSDMELALMTQTYLTRRKPMLSETVESSRKEVA